MTSQDRWPVAIIGTGDTGTDLMTKILRSDGPLTVAAVVGIDPGVDGLLAMPGFHDIRIVFDASSANADGDNRATLAHADVRLVDLTPAAAGPWCVPAVNLDDHLDARYLNMATGGAQATVPIVAAVAQSAIVSYAEVVTSISAKSAAPDMRADIDALTETTAAAVQVVGGAQRGKAMVILNPADPPIPARNTVYCLVDGLENVLADRQRIENHVLAMVDRVSAYIPGYRLKQPVQFETFSAANPLYIPETGKFIGTRVTVLLEVAAAVDIMTSAARAAAERIAAHASETAGAPT
jgi:acetaldehyde dehydrogenase